MNISILDLIIDADIVVQIIMLILILASILSWAIIINKKIEFNKINNTLFKFNKNFDPELSLDECFTTRNDEISKMLITSRDEFFSSENDPTIRTTAKLGLLINKQISKLEKNLTTLATIGSSAPYIGLLGTVWGIMHSFLGLASVKQATIAIVAPGIAEALIATAFGLFAAIPASIYYNKLTNTLDNIQDKYNTIAKEYLIILQR